MANLNGFDATNVDPQFGFDPIPAGEYLAAIVGSVFKSTKKNDGQYLALTFEIVDGDYKGRNLWTNLNLQHTKADTVKFAKAELSAICRAVNVMTPKDSQDLHNIPLIIKVGCKKREDTGEIGNEIKGYKGKSAGQSAPQQPANSQTPPWKR